MTVSTSTVWIDVTGNLGITRIDTTSGIGPILSAIIGASTGDWYQCWEGPLSVNTPVPPGGQYASVVTRASLLFACADGTQVTLLIPSPDASIFMADGKTVDPTATAVSTLITACVGLLVGASGSPVSSYVGGYLMTSASSPL